MLIFVGLAVVVVSAVLYFASHKPKAPSAVPVVVKTEVAKVDAEVKQEIKDEVRKL